MKKRKSKKSIAIFTAAVLATILATAFLLMFSGIGKTGIRVEDRLLTQTLGYFKRDHGAYPPNLNDEKYLSFLKNRYDYLNGKFFIKKVEGYDQLYAVSYSSGFLSSGPFRTWYFYLYTYDGKAEITSPRMTFTRMGRGKSPTDVPNVELKARLKERLDNQGQESGDE